MKVLYISNIPTPYRNEFYNELGKKVELTVVYEAQGASDQGIRFNWDITQVKNYKAVFLKDGDIEEQKLNKKIFKYISREYDYIFTTNYSYRTEMAALIYLKAFRIPYVMEIDGGTIKQENIIKRMVKKFLIGGAKAYFSPSKGTDDFLRNYGVETERIVRTHFTSLRENQIVKKPCTEEEKREYRRSLGISKKRTILGVGQLIYRKGWDTLLTIAKYIDAEIYILGEGENRLQYEEFLRTNEIQNVHLIGFQSNDITSNFYKAADIFVLPTRYDVWGLVINEAMAHGLPIITTTECTSGVELINNNINGKLVMPDSPKDLLEAINGFLNDNRLMMETAKRALETIKPYTIESMVLKHLEYMGKDIK